MVAQHFDHRVQALRGEEDGKGAIIDRKVELEPGTEEHFNVAVTQLPKPFYRMP